MSNDEETTLDFFLTKVEAHSLDTEINSEPACKKTGTISLLNMDTLKDYHCL